MALGVGGALAEGLESGWKMGRQMDQDAETKRARKFQEERQTTTDAQAKQDRDLVAKRYAEQDARQARLDQQTESDKAYQRLLGERKEIVENATAAQAGGGAVPPELGARYGEVSQGIAAARQQALNFFSRAQAGTVDPMSKDVSPGELYTHFTAATGMKPEELRQMPQHLSDIQAGIDTKNDGLTLQGVNGLMTPQLRRGIGDPSPHGGTIMSKEIIRLVPAQDANGQTHPDKVYPVLRVYVKPDGGGPAEYYDAPMTANGSTDEKDRIPPIDLNHAKDYMGNMGLLASATTNPQVAAKLEEGAKQAGGKADQYLAELNRISKTPPTIKGSAGEKLATIQQYARQKGISEDEASKQLQTLGVISSGGGGSGVQARLDAIDDLNAPDEMKERLKRDVVLGAGGRTTGLLKYKDGGSGGGASAGSGSSAALGGATAPTKTDDAVDFWARAVIAGDKDWQVGLGRSKSGSQLIEAVKRRVPTLAKEMGLDSQDIGTTRAQSAALSSTLKDLTKRSEAVELFSNKLSKDMKTYDDLLTKAGSDSPLLINKPLNALRRQFSSPELAQLDLAAKQVGTEYERLISGGALSIAQLHAGAHEDAKSLINGDMPPTQARAVMKTMQTEIKNARDAAHESRTGVQDQMRGLGRGREPAASKTAAPAAPPVGTTQGGYKFKGGDPASPANWEKVK